MLHKILFIHGAAQSAEIAKIRLEPLIKKLRFVAQFVFMDAPYLFANNNVEEKKTTEINPKIDRINALQKRQWWTSINHSDKVWTYDTGKESIQYATKFIQENGPFTCLMGFSQGGSVCQFLPSDIINAFSHLVFVGSYPVENVVGLTRYQTHPKTLHVGGSKDIIVPIAVSQELGKVYESTSDFFMHDKAHCVPTSKEFADALILFLSK